LYFTFILMSKKGVSLNDVKNELGRRRKWKL
jgi:phosphoribosyl-ATP pyrophosphohydrolase